MAELLIAYAEPSIENTLIYLKRRKKKSWKLKTISPNTVMPKTYVSEESSDCQWIKPNIYFSILRTTSSVFNQVSFIYTDCCPMTYGKLFVFFGPKLFYLIELHSCLLALVILSGKTEGKTFSSTWNWNSFLPQFLIIFLHISWIIINCPVHLPPKKTKSWLRHCMIQCITPMSGRR